MTTPLPPPVSVVIPTHERRDLVHRAVRGVVDQSYPGSIEILVVFDQAEPHPIEVEAGSNRTIRTLVNRDRRPGLAGARNTGIIESRGDYVAFCDDDDAWLPDKLEAQVRKIQAHAGACVCATGVVMETDNGHVTREAPRAVLRHRDFVRSRIMEVHPSTLLIPRLLLTETVGLVDESVPHGYGEDYDLLLRITERYPVVCVPESLVLVSFHEGSYFTSRWQNVIDGLEYLLDKHPALSQDRRGHARILGQLAFAHGGLGQRRKALRRAGSALAGNPTDLRAYAAIAVATGVSAQFVAAAARRTGRGI
jgi:glycosyltransferase involved in cell wall biosynthesis